VAAEVEGSGSEGRPLSTAQAVITPRNSVAIPIQILVIGLVPFDLFVLVSRNRQQRRTRQISGMHGDRISIEIAIPIVIAGTRYSVQSIDTTSSLQSCFAAIIAK
jgi:hypothetical protein